MHNKHLHNTWISSLILIAILLSSIASSTPLKPMRMNMSTSSASTMQMQTTDEFCHEMTPSQQLDNHCNKKNVDMDICCSIVFASVFIFISNLLLNHFRPSSFGLLAVEPTHRQISRSSSLFRPPIFNS